MEPEKNSKMKPLRRGQIKTKVIGSILGQAIHNLVPWLHKEVADIRDVLESFRALLGEEDADDSKAEKNGGKVAYAFLHRIDLLVNKLKPGGSGGSIDCLDGSTENLFKYAQSVFQVFSSKLVKKAGKFAIKSILLQARKSLIFRRRKPLNRNRVGYLICTAILLASSSNSDEVVAAGLLLHTEPRYKAMKKEFGMVVAELVQDVSKLNKLSKISREGKLENSKHMPDLIMAMGADVRAMMIKIAEHTVRMLALDTLNSKKKQGFISETLNVYVPLSERLGFNSWKNQLENLCVPGHDELKKLHESVSEYDVDDIAFEVKLRDALKEEKLNDFHVESRKKSLLSTLNKMSEYRSSDEGKNKMSEDSILFSKIRDIIGLRIIVEHEKECYRAKVVVEKLWKADPNFERDYIKTPKKDGYKSLHVCVKNAKDQYMEVQIRTNEMHKEFDDSHWLYKEGSSQVPEDMQKLVRFARLVIKQAKGNCKFPGKRPLYVIVKEKDKVTIEEHSTDNKLKDLRRLKGWQGEVLVNEVHEGLNYTLRAGDIIEFVRAPSQSLFGALSWAIANLTNLSRMLFQNNNISGHIPPELGTLAKRQTLYLSNNRFSGAVRESFGQINRLQYLFLSCNASWRLNNSSLYGPFPVSLAKIPQLTFFNLFYNNLSGPFPKFPARTFNIVGSPLICGSSSSDSCFGSANAGPLCFSLNGSLDKDKSKKLAAVLGVSLSFAALLLVSL